MKLTEALCVLNEAERLQPGAEFPVLLACGFTPLHLETFLAAHLQRAVLSARVKITSGLYGDLAGTIEREPTKDIHGIAIVLEWPDLDPRLGFRRLGGWSILHEGEIAVQAHDSLQRIGYAIEILSRSVPIAVSLPTLPLPPAFHPPGCEAGRVELELRSDLAKFATRLASQHGVSVVSPDRLLEKSPFEGRLDPRAELLTGHPYSVRHADVLGGTLARLLLPAQPKKGLITDLDDTVWSGLVGEVGPGAVSWDLENHTQLHGLYQQVLAALADQGALLAVATKNDPANIEEVFLRRDMRLSRDKVFPLEANWGIKSESVGRILAAWNVSADSVVFVDDNPMELAQVKSAWPEMECLLFPKNDYNSAVTLFRTLRDLFGKRDLVEEDRYRLASIRSVAGSVREEIQKLPHDQFLSQAEAVFTAQLNPPVADSRVLELVNKTNQFNLNGIRYTQADWQRSFYAPNSFLLVVSYRDKYGPLGKIGVLAGEREERVLRVHTWVMSCRAFSRRIEHGCLDLLFSHFDVDEIRLEFNTTAKNSPFRACFRLLVGDIPEGPFSLTRGLFLQRRPPLYFKVETEFGTQGDRKYTAREFAPSIGGAGDSATYA